MKPPDCKLSAPVEDIWKEGQLREKISLGGEGETSTLELLRGGLPQSLAPLHQVTSLEVYDRDTDICVTPSKYSLEFVDVNISLNGWSVTQHHYDSRQDWRYGGRKWKLRPHKFPDLSLSTRICHILNHQHNPLTIGMSQ